MGQRQSNQSPNGAGEQGHNSPEHQIADVSGRQTSDTENTEQRSNYQNQSDNAAVTNLSSQNTGHAGASREASSSNADNGDRRGRRRERQNQPETARTSSGRRPLNVPLLRVAGRLRQKSGKPRSSSTDRLKRSSSPLASRRRSSSWDGAQNRPGLEQAVQGSFNVVPSSTNPQTAGTVPSRRRSLESLDLQSRQINSPSGNIQVEAGPSNANSSRSSRLSNEDEGLRRRHSSASLASRFRPRNYLIEARNSLLENIARNDGSPRPKANLKNYPFARETARAVVGYASIEGECAQLKEKLSTTEHERNALVLENNKLSLQWSGSEDNVAQLQTALENEIEEKDEIIAKRERARKNVAHEGTQTDDSGSYRTEASASTQTASTRGTQTEVCASTQTTTTRGTQTEAEVVAGILDKYKDRLAAARSSSRRERRVNWSQLTPKGLGMRRFFNTHAESGGSGVGNSTSDNDGNQQVEHRGDTASPPRLARFTFEMHERHVTACKEEAERLNAKKQ